MKRYRLREQKWYPNAVAACIAVVLYVLLTHVKYIRVGLKMLGSFFSPVILGCVLAYLMNPLAKFYRRRLFARVRSGNRAWVASAALAVVSVLLVIVILLATLIPQLVASVSAFVGNLDGYSATLSGWLVRLEDTAAGTAFDMESLVDSSQNILKTAVDYIKENAGRIIDTSVTAGKNIFNWVIAFILSIYLLTGKEKLKSGTSRLLRALMPAERYEKLIGFLGRCNWILIRYIVFSLLDAVIVGVANAIFMAIAGMPYVGLVSVVVAAANLVPTFGPLVGGLIGAFILVLIRPWHALWFLVFTLVLQTLDGYFIKPRLFGDSLGVPGLWILVAVVVGGRIFGIVGILVAIPFAAIADFLYRDYLMPWLEARRRETDAPDKSE